MTVTGRKEGPTLCMCKVLSSIPALKTRNEPRPVHCRKKGGYDTRDLFAASATQHEGVTVISAGQNAQSHTQAAQRAPEITAKTPTGREVSGD